MKKVFTRSLYFAVFGIFAAMLFLLSGCKTKQSKTESDPIFEAIPGTKEEIIQELSGYPIPNSYEVTKLIYESGAPFILSLANPPEKAENYITEKDKILNLGVYATDLVYATTYMMKQATLNYLEASKTLIDDLGISTTFNLTYAERIENNMNDRDSLIMIVSESFSDTWNHLVENQQDILARLVVCGSWIEGIYITSNVALKAKDNSEFLEMLAKQSNSLDRMVSMLEPVKDEDEVSNIYKALFELQDLYTNVGEALTSAQLDEIAAKVNSLRAEII